MKIGLRIACALAFLLWLPGARAADQSGNLNGVWKGAFEFQGGTIALTFHLAAADSAVTGTVEGLPTTPAEIHEGKLDGSAVSFWVNTDYQGQTYKLICKGTISAAGDEIAMTLATDDGSWGAQLTAKRSTDVVVAPAAPDVSGDWKGAFDFEGKSVALTFHLKGAAGAVTGTVDGLAASPTDIHEGKIDGDTVTFWLNTDYQGQTYKLVYRGKIAAGQIAFTFGTDDGSWSAELMATKSL
jgi:hypothetical protein